jgi:hypothetical protein
MCVCVCVYIAILEMWEYERILTGQGLGRWLAVLGADGWMTTLGSC